MAIPFNIINTQAIADLWDDKISSKACSCSSDKREGMIMGNVLLGTKDASLRWDVRDFNWIWRKKIWYIFKKILFDFFNIRRKQLMMI